MRPNGEQAALARRVARTGFFIGLLLALLGAWPAVAGDRAELTILGYSPDGRYFAFEQYGIQDGSGFAYSDIFVLDLPADKWMYGSPFRAQADDSNPEQPLAEIRAKALAHAESKLKETGIAVPATILALIGDGVAGNDGKSLSFSAPPCCGPGQVSDKVFTLTLSTIPAKSNEDYCATANPVGYALNLEHDGSSKELHRDGATLPGSRGCTLDYRLYAVAESFGGSAGQRVAIISTYPFGFEGPDRRFLAVPLGN